jgi:hypothetical protein
MEASKLPFSGLECGRSAARARAAKRRSVGSRRRAYNRRCASETSQLQTSTDTWISVLNFQ